ncbi:MAG: hypothetical protein ACRD19_14995 [Terriglobia bacterium]
MNVQRAHAADRMHAPGVKPLAAEAAPVAIPAVPANAGAAETTLHDHGDGTFHTESHDGERAEHPSIGHALMHLAAKHSGGKHMHIHHDGEAMTSHHVDEQGDIEGPHEHETPEDLADHVSNVMGGEMPQAEEAGDEPVDSLSGLGGY